MRTWCERHRSRPGQPTACRSRVADRHLAAVPPATLVALAHLVALLARAAPAKRGTHAPRTSTTATRRAAHLLCGSDPDQPSPRISQFDAVDCRLQIEEGTTGVVRAVQTWSGYEARALRTALRASVRDFAARLGISPRAVSKWEAGGRNIQPRPETQAILDTALEKASREAQDRFEVLVTGGSETETTSSNEYAQTRIVKRVGNGASIVSTSLQAEQRLAQMSVIERPLGLSPEEAQQLSGLVGNIVELHLRVEIDIAPDGWASVTYRHDLFNMSARPLTRLAREVWFENTDGPIVIEPTSGSQRHLSILRVHDTAHLAKFGCQISPAVQPGESATVAYTCKGGQFLNDHYWRQSLPRYTRHLAINLRHYGVQQLINCTATEEHPDGAENSATEDLIWDYDGDAVVITLIRDYLMPNQAMTLRWEVRREGA